jgi:GMP synthase (glutamine-hydrolysing)
MLPLNTPPEKLVGYGAIIISGGPGSCYAADAPQFNKAVLSMGLPVLGVCYGYQLLNYAEGGKVCVRAPSPTPGPTAPVPRALSVVTTEY